MRLSKTLLRPLSAVSANIRLDMRRFLVNPKASDVAPAPNINKVAEKAVKAVPAAASSSTVASTAPMANPASKENVNNEVSECAKLLIDNTSASFADRLRAVPLPSDLSSSLTWKAGEPVPYAAVVSTFEDISQKSGRLDKEALLARLFRQIVSTSPQDLESCVYVTFNQVHPVYDGLELGVGDSLLVKAICEATGRKKESVEEDYEKEGDLGVVALLSRSAQKTLSFVAKPKPLSAAYVLEQFRAITQIKGEKAQSRKVELMKGLLVKCQGQEAKYIIRALQGKLRIGLAEQTVLVSLANMFLDLQQQLQMDTTTTTYATTSAIADSPPSSPAPSLANSDSEEEVEAEPTPSTKKKARKTKKREAEKEKETETEPINDAIDPATLSSLSALELLEKVQDKETPEATSLRRHLGGASRLPREKALEAAQIAVKRAFSECPNLSLLLEGLMSGPLCELYKRCRLRIGIPVAPMLAKPTKQIAEVLSRLEGLAFTMEYKYDGERAQVHVLRDGEVKIFSRNSEDNSEKYPDLKDVVKTARQEGIESLILDAEVVAYDREKNTLLPFQVLSTRKRKVENADEEQKVKVILQVFDLLYLNDKSLLRESLRTRRELLRKALSHSNHLLHFASGSDHVEDGDTAPIEVFLTEACSSMCEGLMVKTLDAKATYEPSKRSLNWLKLKKDYINGMGVCDSVDLVPIGGYYGKGKRTSFFGAYLMACYDPDSDEYQSICKVGTGFKDEDLLKLAEQMRTMAIPKKPVNFNVHENLTPDVWFEAAGVVWELQAADLSRSSVHRGGVGRLENGGALRGIGLRFPRYLRERGDKKAEQATTAEQIVDMFYSQAQGEQKEDDDEDGEGI